MEKNKQEKKEKDLKEALKDPVFTSYNLLIKLEDIKKINYAILQLLNEIYVKITKAPKEKQKEEREGTFS
jgi:hypothetical protein